MFGKTGAADKRGSQRSQPSIERLDVADLHFADTMAEARWVELPGRGKAFVRVAEGPAGAPTVLLVHGLFATADLNWSTAIPMLAERYNVIAPDLRGHGRGLRTSHFTGEECADDLAAIVSALDAGRVIVVGYSLGGLIAQIFARKHPELVAGLVLCATACSFYVPTTEGGPVALLERAARMLPEGMRRAALLAVLKPRSAGSPRGRWLMGEVRRHDTLALLDATAEAARFDSTTWVSGCDRPAAVIVTTEDRVVPAETQRELARALGRAEVREVAGDHFACVKRPVEFNAVLVAACERVAAAE